MHQGMLGLSVFIKQLLFSIFILPIFQVSAEGRCKPDANPCATKASDRAFTVTLPLVQSCSHSFTLLISTTFNTFVHEKFLFVHVTLIHLQNC